MKSKNLLIIFGLIITLILIGGACSAGFVAGRASDAVDLSQFDFSGELPKLGASASVSQSGNETGTEEDIDELFEPFWQTWDLVDEEYVDQPVDQEVLMRGAIRGMLQSLGDQHTSYLDPEMFEQANAVLEGEEYEGIGAWVDITGEFLEIISPMPGSPAEKAGLQPGDKVIAIDGDDMTGIDGELVRQRILGPKGSVVVITILREGDSEPFDVEITRASISTPSIESSMLEDNLAYVRLYTFGDSTTKELRKGLQKLLKEDPQGLILDLRFNGGGYLPTAIEVVSEFIGDGIVMFEEYGDGELKTYEAKKGGLATEIPLIVLINEGSASASEIVAGAIQDRGRGQLVGTTSFGKGSVQVYTALENEQGAVRVTVARWLTPSERQIMGEGLMPDFEVVITEEDIAADVDSQLQKAIELLSQNQ